MWKSALLANFMPRWASHYCLLAPLRGTHPLRETLSAAYLTVQSAVVSTLGQVHIVNQVFIRSPPVAVAVQSLREWDFCSAISQGMDVVIRVTAPVHSTSTWQVQG